MGLAWFDEDTDPLAPSSLHTGGLPQLGDHPWPECPRCGVPMLFRAQLPLGVTSLVGPDDDRLVLVFECHAQDRAGVCGAGEVIVTTTDATPATPPAVRTFNVVVESTRDDGMSVRSIARTLGEDGEDGGDDLDELPIPGPVLLSQPESIATQAKSLLEAAGAVVVLKPAAPVTLEATHEGILVPFDEGAPGMTKTTLPPLTSLVEGTKKRRIRALVGGATPGHRDLKLPCTCGKPTKTALRLLASSSDPVVKLGSSMVQLCLSCSRGSLHRTG